MVIVKRAIHQKIKPPEYELFQNNIDEFLWYWGNIAWHHVEVMKQRKEVDFCNWDY
jgi:hypothetical protein